MTDANDERLFIEGIKKENHPRRLNWQTMQALEVMVAHETQFEGGMHEARLRGRRPEAEGKSEGKPQESLKDMTQRFLQESYEELASKPMDEPCFDNSEKFMGAMVRGVISRAQLHALGVRAEQQLSGGRGR